MWILDLTKAVKTNDLTQESCATVSLNDDLYSYRETGAGPRGERSKIIPTDHGEVRSLCIIWVLDHVDSSLTQFKDHNHVQFNQSIVFRSNLSIIISDSASGKTQVNIKIKKSFLYKKNMLHTECCYTIKRDSSVRWFIFFLGSCENSDVCQRTTPPPNTLSHHLSKYKRKSSYCTYFYRDLLIFSLSAFE